MHAVLTNTDSPHFLPFFFLMLPVLLAVSTRTASSSLTALPGVPVGLGPLSISFMNSDWMDALRFSHHSFSESVWAWISSRRVLNIVPCAISFADEKIVWPQFGARAFAFRKLAWIRRIFSWTVYKPPLQHLWALLPSLSPRAKTSATGHLQCCLSVIACYRLALQF